MKLTCIICAYNEAPRIGTVLEAVAGHPLIDEAIVVNDCSTDDTAEVVSRFPGVRLLDLPHNVGKSHALVHGMRAAQGDTVLLLDADLSGITADDVSLLIEPVRSRNADVSISLRKNAFPIHHWFGLDFTSGERVLSKALLGETLRKIDSLPPFGIESYMNSLIIARGLRLTIVPWKNVEHMRKSQKYGWLRGTLSDWGMAVDVLRVLSPIEIVRQNSRLLKLSRAQDSK